MTCADADRDVGVAGEVAVDLERERHRARDERQSGEAARRVVHAVRQLGQPVGDDDLLDAAPTPSAAGRRRRGRSRSGAPRGTGAAGAAAARSGRRRAADRTSRTARRRRSRARPLAALGRPRSRSSGSGTCGTRARSAGAAGARERRTPCPIARAASAIVSLKKSKYLKTNSTAQVDDDAEHEPEAPARARRRLDAEPRDVVDEDRDGEDRDVRRHERHVEHAAREQQHRPAPPVRQREVEQRDDREEQRELEGVEEHCTGRRVTAGRAPARVATFAARRCARSCRAVDALALVRCSTRGVAGHAPGRHDRPADPAVHVSATLVLAGSVVVATIARAAVRRSDRGAAAGFVDAGQPEDPADGDLRAHRRHAGLVLHRRAACTPSAALCGQRTGSPTSDCTAPRRSSSARLVAGVIKGVVGRQRPSVLPRNSGSYQLGSRPHRATASAPSRRGIRRRRSRRRPRCRARRRAGGRTRAG